MPTRRRTPLAWQAVRANHEQLVRMGALVREARTRRDRTQTGLGARVGLSQAAISRAERGRGGGLTVDAWQRIAIALGIPLRISFQRDALEDVADAGHLAVQELVLRLTAASGSIGSFELATKPHDPWRSADVCILNDAARRMTIAECWNTIGDLGAGVRSSSRKVAEAEALAVARWGDEPHRVGLVWIVRATARNRAIAARYPEVFAHAFRGSSEGWVRSLTAGSSPPSEPGLVWCDVRATRLFGWRRRARDVP